MNREIKILSLKKVCILSCLGSIMLSLISYDTAKLSFAASSLECEDKPMAYFDSDAYISGKDFFLVTSLSPYSPQESIFLRKEFLAPFYHGIHLKADSEVTYYDFLYATDHANWVGIEKYVDAYYLPMTNSIDFTKTTTGVHAMRPSV